MRVFGSVVDVRLTLVASSLALLLVTGCMVGPNYRTPETKMPDQWRQAATAGMAEGRANLQTWWTVFDDPTLTDLIQRSGVGNLGLQDAVYRVQQARAQRGIATGELFPTLGGNVDYTRASVSHVSRGNTSLSPVGLTNAGFDSTWEIDVFGGIRRNIESATAILQASVEQYRDVMVTLYAEIGLNYADVRTLQERLAFARDNVDRQRQTLDLVKSRFQNGLVPQLDVRQAESNLANSESQIPSFQAGMVQAIDRLSVLLGKEPACLQDELSRPGPIPKTSAQVTLDMPLDLLRQRPDVREAERTLAAASAQIGVTTADLYPHFSLSGTYAAAGTQAFGVSVWPWAWSFGPAMRWDIFDGVRNVYRVRAAQAVTGQSRALYEQTVLSAMNEVEDAIVGYAQEQIRRDALLRAVVAQREAVDLVQDLYKNGLTDFQNVLDTERFLFQQEDQLAVSEGLVTKDLISLYKALGGGWSPETPLVAPAFGQDGLTGQTNATGSAEAATQPASQPAKE